MTVRIVSLWRWVIEYSIFLAHVLSWSLASWLLLSPDYQLTNNALLEDLKTWYYIHDTYMYMHIYTSGMYNIQSVKFVAKNVRCAKWQLLYINKNYTSSYYIYSKPYKFNSLWFNLRVDLYFRCCYRSFFNFYYCCCHCCLHSVIIDGSDNIVLLSILLSCINYIWLHYFVTIPN